MLNCDITKEEKNEELNVTHGENSGIVQRQQQK